MPNQETETYAELQRAIGNYDRAHFCDADTTSPCDRDLALLHMINARQHSIAAGDIIFW